MKCVEGKSKIERNTKKLKIYTLLTGENPLALADGMKPDGLTVTATLSGGQLLKTCRLTSASKLDILYLDTIRKEIQI